MGPKVYRSRLGAVGQVGSCGGAKTVAVALFAVDGGAETILTKKQKKSIIETTERGQETKYKTRDDKKEKEKTKEKKSRT